MLNKSSASTLVQVTRVGQQVFFESADSLTEPVAGRPTARSRICGQHRPPDVVAAAAR